MALSTSGITTSLVGEILETSSRDVGTLCTHNNINMWSKKKPVRLSSATPDRSGEWWKGNNYNCGIVPYRITHYNNLPDLYENNWANDDNNGWIYERPNGSTFPYRLADFGGYNHTASTPFFNFSVPSTVALDQSSFYCDAMRPIGGDGQLLLSDIGTLEDCYFGCLLVKDGQSGGIRATSSSVDSASVRFSTVGLTIGNYTAYPFISSKQYNQNDVDYAANYYSIPNLKPATFRVITSNTTITIRANVNSDNTSISYTVTVTTTGSLTLRNNYIRLRYGNKDWLDPMVVGEQQIKLDDYTVSNGTTTLTSGTFTRVPSDLIRNAKVWVSLSSGKYLKFVVPMMSPILP